MKEELLSRLDLFVAKIADVSPKIWAIYVRQQYAESFQLLLGGVVFLPLFLFSMNKLTKAGAWKKDCLEEGDSFWVVLMFISGVMSIICVLGFFMFGLSQLINPEYYAIKDIVSFIK